MDFFRTLKASFLRRFSRAAFFLATLTLLFGLIAILGSAAVAIFNSTHLMATLPFLKGVFVIWSMWTVGVLGEALLMTMWDGVMVLIRGDGKTL